MVFTFAINVPSCRYLADQRGVTPQLYADNLKCTTIDDHPLHRAACFSDNYTGAFGQEVSPRKSVLPRTSKTTRRRMKC